MAGSILLHALAPGRFPEPDMRCFARLAATAADPDNGFAVAYPERIRKVLEHPSDTATPQAVLRSWWKANDETAFFRHSETARAVRHTVVFPDAGQQSVRRRWRR